MANPSKAKGTAAETALLHDLNTLTGRTFRRTPPGTKYDLVSYGTPMAPVIRILATRPDYGRWLLTMPLADWWDSAMPEAEIRVEVKRYKTFRHHGIWAEKFGTQ